METSQAVSMLQPFRHPKPGLIIMDKTVEDKFIEWLEFQFEFEMHSVTKMSVKTKLQRYIDEVSRERANAYVQYLIDKYEEIWGNPDEYDEWKSKQK